MPVSLCQEIFEVFLYERSVQVALKRYLEFERDSDATHTANAVGLSG